MCLQNDIILIKKAGEGFLIGGGILIPLGVSDNAEAQLGIGWKEDKISADNGKVAFHRIPLDALVFFKAANFRLGGGVTYHLNPEMSGHGYVGAADASFKDAFGFLVEADVVFEMFFMGIRGVFVDYENLPVTIEVDGNSVEVLFGVRF